MDRESLSTALRSLVNERAELKGSGSKRRRQRLNRKIKTLRHRLDILDASAGADKTTNLCNFMSSSEPGCHVAYFNAPWIVDTGSFRLEDFGLDDVASMPDISIDPESGLLSVANTSDVCKSYTITIAGEGSRLIDQHGRVMTTGIYWDNDGVQKTAITLILAVRPMCLMDVCFVPLDRLKDRSPRHIDLSSDVTDIKPHAIPKQDWYFEANRNAAYRFPLLTSDDADSYSLGEVTAARLQHSYLCSQGFGGHFTHFIRHTCHAIDLECPTKTPIVAIADGVVEEVRQKAKCGGIHVKHLREWNSILLRLSDGHFVEYVHIATDSCALSVGDVVKRGQIICASGSVGFCPTPHLHIQMHVSGKKDAPTVPFAFSFAGTCFVPRAGKWYSQRGEEKLSSHGGEAAPVAREEIGSFLTPKPLL